MKGRLTRRDYFWEKNWKLDQLNECLANETPFRHLHPTKGYRQMSNVRLVADAITAERKLGKPWPFAAMRLALAKAGVIDVRNNQRDDKEDC